METEDDPKCSECNIVCDYRKEPYAGTKPMWEFGKPETRKPKGLLDRPTT